ncbi:MAG TPA: hypothetical protein VNF04_06660 [Stellaceae bacterium]|nr:hypothetical protein [Stellaceae bacterium]
MAVKKPPEDQLDRAYRLLVAQAVDARTFKLDTPTAEIGDQNAIDGRKSPPEGKQAQPGKSAGARRQARLRARQRLGLHQYLVELNEDRLVVLLDELRLLRLEDALDDNAVSAALQKMLGRLILCNAVTFRALIYGVQNTDGSGRG